MTATIKPPDRERRPRQRVPRFSSMESLGFSDSTHVWSDSPRAPQAANAAQGQGAADPFSDWVPSDVGRRLDGRNFRWSLLLLSLFILGAIAGTAWWLYQRPVAQAEASESEVSRNAADLESALPLVEASNSMMPAADGTSDMTPLDEVDAAARELFNNSGALADSTQRSAAAAASSAALDAVRLVRDAHSYRMAIVPLLSAPDLETDPELIALDEAARSFGDWQLTFDQVRSALPDDILSEVTQEFELISAQLPSVLTEFVDALRQDDQAQAQMVLGDLAGRLGQAERRLDDSLLEIQSRVSDRIVEARQALTELSG